MKKCLICYQELEENNSEYDSGYHSKCSKKLFGQEQAPVLPHKLADIQALAKKNINKNLSVTGVQKKLSVGLDRTVANPRLTLLDEAAWGSYILKPPTAEYPEMPEAEDLTMHLANLAGIETVPHCLIELASGQLAYLTRRVDRQFQRNKATKIHMEDACQLTERLTEDKYKGSVEQVGRIIKANCRGIDVVNFYELIVFCFITGNSDMHLKNFSLLYTIGGGFTFAPAYDLLPTQLLNPLGKEESALTINGKKNKLKLQDFFALADTLNIAPKARDNALQRIGKNTDKILQFINQSFLSSGFKKEYKSLIQQRSHKLFGL
jgi:serine/threonine-protein kinase HipA